MSLRIHDWPRRLTSHLLRFHGDSLALVLKRRELTLR